MSFVWRSQDLTSQDSLCSLELKKERKTVHPEDKKTTSPRHPARGDSRPGHLSLAQRQPDGGWEDRSKKVLGRETLDVFVAVNVDPLIFWFWPTQTTSKYKQQKTETNGKRKKGKSQAFGSLREHWFCSDHWAFGSSGEDEGSPRQSVAWSENMKHWNNGRGCLAYQNLWAAGSCCFLDVLGFGLSLVCMCVMFGLSFQVCVQGCKLAASSIWSSSLGI